MDVRNKKGNSSLWLAANGGHLDVVQLLHSAGADIDSQDNRKVSCLMASFRKGHSKVVSIFFPITYQSLRHSPAFVRWNFLLKFGIASAKGI